MTQNEALIEARNMVAAAREAIATARSRKAERLAYEELDYWQGRSAMLEIRRGWA